MSKCRQCHLEILDETERCPLCNSVLEQTIDVENMYPNVWTKSRKWALAGRIYLFVAILMEVLLVYINAMTEKESGIWWSAIAGLGLLYGYMLIRFAILGRSGYKGKTMVLVMIAILIAVAVDFVVGYQGWSVNFALPSGILLVDVGIVVLMIYNSRNWQSYIMWQIGMICLSAMNLLLYPAEIVTSPYLAAIALAVSGALFLGTVIIGDRRARVELRRRFHI